MSNRIVPTRGEISALDRLRADAVGKNRDGIVNDESRGAGEQKKPGWLARNPVAQGLNRQFETGFSTKDERGRLDELVASRKKQWGAITTLPPARLAKMSPLFEAQKTIDLVRFGRTPKDVVDGFVSARGTVDGEPIAPRDLFFQRWKPLGEPSGTVVVVAPGFQQTGRNFLEQVQLLNRQGHEVLVMDQQWAGHSDGTPGGVDRGFGITRDVAAMTAEAAKLAGPKGRVVIAGTSMGGGAGALGAITMNDAGRIRLEGAQMPKGVSVVLQAPFFEASPNALNGFFGALGHVPGVGTLPLPPLGVPTFSHDPVVQAKLATRSAADHVRGTAAALNSSNADLARMRALIGPGVPQGKVFIIHAEHDPLASSAASAEVVKQLGPRAKLLLLDGADHLHDQNPKTQGTLLEGLAWVTAG